MRRTTMLLIAAPALLAGGCAAASPTPSSSSVAASAVTSASAAPTTATTPSSSSYGTSTGGGSDGGTTSVARCHTADLKLSTGQGDGAAGTEYLALVFTNKSDHTCTLYGYPGTSWVAGDDGHQVGNPFQRGGSNPKVTITLKSGQQAHADLQLPNTANYSAGDCGAVPVRGLRIYPPDETASIFVPTTGLEACAGKHVTPDIVWSIASGASLSE